MEEIFFCCLGCHKNTFKGKRDKLTQTFECPGLIRHIKRKQDRNGELACLAVYQSLPTHPTLDINISTSVCEELSPTGHHNNRLKPVPSNVEIPPFAPDDSSLEDEDDVGIDDFNSPDLKEDHPLADLFLPKSNTLSNKGQFLKSPPTGFATDAIKQLNGLKILQLVQGAFDGLAHNSMFFSLLCVATTVCHVDTIVAMSDRRVPSPPQMRSDGIIRRYLDFSTLADISCDARAQNIKNLHFRMVHIMPNSRDDKRVCKKMKVLDIENGFMMDESRIPTRVTDDHLYFEKTTGHLLRMFP